MSDIIYHHTTLAHLPFIVQTEELRGSRASEHWPEDFVWATLDERGDRTTAACQQKQIPRVRIMMPMDVFRSDWQVLAIEKGWRPDQVTALCDTAANKLDINHWLATPSPVPIQYTLNAEVKTWSTPWRDVDIHSLVASGEDQIGFIENGKGWLSRRNRMKDDAGVARMHYFLTEVKS